MGGGLPEGLSAEHKQRFFVAWVITGIGKGCVEGVAVLVVLVAIVTVCGLDPKKEDGVDAKEKTKL